MVNLAQYQIRRIFLILCLVALGGCGGDSNNQTNPTGTVVPQGAWSSQQTVTNRYAPTGFNAVVGWVQAATLTKTQTGVPATIEVDYMRLIEDDPVTGTTVLSDVNYDVAAPQGLTINQGGLYDRSPTWFANNDHHVAMTNSTIQNGTLTIDVSATPDNIPHWWTDRKNCKTTATYYLEMRVRITGQVGLQLGGDFWTTLTSPWAGYNVNNREYFASDWYGDTNGQFIVIRAPRF